MSGRRRPAFWGALLGVFLVASCAGPGRRDDDVARLAKSGRWLTAGEELHRRLKERPDDKEAAARLAELEATVAAAADNTAFDPRRYFYAQAYRDYFHGRRFVKSIEDMEQVLVYELENEEILDFMDKAQAHVDEELRRTAADVAERLDKVAALRKEGRSGEALPLCQQVLALEPANAAALDCVKRIRLETAAVRTRRTAGAQPAAKEAAAPPPPPPDPDWIESQYREALKSYVGGDVTAAVKLLRDLARQDPANERLAKTLQRMEQEDPSRARKR